VRLSGKHLRQKKDTKKLFIIKKITMDISGTLTGAATVTQIAGGKEVVNFNMAMNETYKTKEGKFEERTEFIRCAYWGSANVAKILTEGTGVCVTGWLTTHAWKDKTTDEAKSRLEMKARRIQLIGKVVRENPAPIDHAEAVPVTETTDDLPF
jgi:single-strand DNA-binding protein